MTGETGKYGKRGEEGRRKRQSREVRKRKEEHRLPGCFLKYFIKLYLTSNVQLRKNIFSSPSCVSLLNIFQRCKTNLVHFSTKILWETLLCVYEQLNKCSKVASECMYVHNYVHTELNTKFHILTWWIQCEHNRINKTNFPLQLIYKSLFRFYH